MRLHDLTCSATTGNSARRFQLRCKPQRRFTTTLVHRGIARIVSVLLVMSLLGNSTPAAAQTIVSVTNEASVTFAFWWQRSASVAALKRVFTGRYLPRAATQERQSDRNAKVTRLRITPGDVTARIGEVVRFSAIAYSKNDDTVGGVDYRWSVSGDDESMAAIDSTGLFSAQTAGEFKVSAKGAGRTAETVITVLENIQVAEEQNPTVRHFSTRNAPPPDRPQTSTARRNSRSDKTAVFQKASFNSEESSSATTPPPMQGSDQFGWNLNNYMTADDPGSQPGNPPGAPADDGAGNGNFQLSAPVLSLPGRGIDVSLALTYNAHLWHKAGSNITYDIDRGWPAAGWSFGFGKMADIGDGGTIIIEADGTRHGFNGTATGPLPNSTFSGRTNDGSFIDYTCIRQNGVITLGTATHPNGTVVHYGAAGDGAVHPVFIIDPNGNFIHISYRNNVGPQIDAITDTMGRVINFHYNSNNLLTAVTAPALNGAGTRTVVRLHYQQQLVNASFSGVTPLVRAPTTRWLIDAIYFPATSTGFWFNESNSFLPGYGTIARVIEQRGMAHSTSGLTDMGTVTPGTMTNESVYAWQTTPANDAPTYTSLTETWAHMDTGPVVTNYLLNQNASPRTTTVTLPNGVKSIQYAHNAPGQFNDGKIFKDETYDTDGTTLLVRNEVTWAQGDYNSARPVTTTATTRQGTTYVTTGTEYSYLASPSFNQLIETRNYDYGYIVGGSSNTLLRKTVVQYENSSNYTNRHIFNLPKVVSVYDGNNVRVSQAEYSYDAGLPANTPGVIQHLDEFDPYAPSVTQPGHWITQCTGCPPCSCVPVWVPPTTSFPYKPENAYRGNVTQIKTYADAAALTESTAVTETRTYDMTGNVIEASTSCCQETSFEFTTATHYAYPEKQTRGSATDQFAQVVTSAIYDFNTGLVKSATDANNSTTETEYFDSLRPQRLILPTGAHTDYAYDDNAMTVTETSYLSGHPTDTGLAEQTVRYLNGRGQSRRDSSLAATPAVFDFIDNVYDNMGRLSQQSALYRTGETKQWTTIAYDGLGRTTRLTAPDGSVSETYYNEVDFDTSDSYQPTRPNVGIANAPGERTLIRDAWGRERWGRTNSQGKLVEVVEPNPSGSGSVATGGLLTSYSYTLMGSLSSIVQGSQTRTFKHDSLGRLTAQKLAETLATLNDAGTYVGTGSGTWSEVFTYDQRSRMTSRTDARGVKTVYNYNNDPLNRLQSISWDTSGFGDTANPILAAKTVTYAYRTKTTGTERKDVTQIASITTADTATESYNFDADGRINVRTLTLTSRPSYPFVTDYIYDELNRVKDVLYPAEYTHGSQPRKQVHNNFDVASRLSGLTVDGQTFASNIVYDASSQITSLRVGQSGPNQIIENYGFSPQTGLMESQTIARDSAPSNYLLNLSYDYANANGKRTGQLTKILNNLNHNKDRSYTYDAIGRLTQAKGGPSGTLWTQTYAYDRYGNRTSVTATGVSAQNQRPDKSTRMDQLAKNIFEPPPFLANDGKSISDSPLMLRPADTNTVSLEAVTPPIFDPPPTFTDDPLTSSVTVQALHVTELRNAINLLRVRAGLTTVTWAEAVSAGVQIRASHITEMRTRLEQARTALGLSATVYTDPSLAAGFLIKKEHIQDLRNSLVSAWNTSSQISRDGHASITYDQASNRITTSGFAYDAAGNQVRALVADGGASRRFQYDAANRLVKVTTDDNAITLATYTYADTNELLISEEAAGRTYYVGDGGEVTMAEYFESTAATVPAWTRSYVYLGARLLSTVTPNGSGDTIEHHHPDRLGTRIVTNPATGTSFEQIALPFGTPLNSESTGATNRRFTTYDRSETTGLDYAVNRRYDSQQGRFTQVDPIGMSSTDQSSPQTLNLYAYCANDPINQSDPSGLGFFSFFGKLLNIISKITKIIKIVLAVVVVVAVAILLTVSSPALIAFANFLLFKVAPALTAMLGAKPNSQFGIATPPWGGGQTPVPILGSGFQDQDPVDVIVSTVNCENTWPAPGSNAENCPGAPWYKKVWSGTKIVAGYAWKGIKQYSYFTTGQVNQWMPATKWARNGVEWAIGTEIIDENSTAYKAGGWYFFGVQTVVSGGVATNENIAIKLTNPIRDRILRWGVGSFKLHDGTWVRNALHVHIGYGKGLMKHHLPQQFRAWRGNLWNNIKKWKW